MNQPVTFITGASRGIGRFLVGHYLARGHIVAGCSRKPFEGEAPAGYEHFVADVTSEADARRIFSALRREHGGVDHLINNAGIAAMNHCLLTPLETAERILRTNVAGSFLYAREAAKVMQTRRRGRIVNFSSVAVPLQVEGEALYASSKAAVATLTAIMARELAAFGITVNCIGPTPIDTDLIRSVPKEKMDALVARQAIKRMGTFADVANVIDFFLSDASGFVTGQTLYLGGA